MSAEPFTTLASRAVPLVRDNIDTDAIIPSREMTSVSKKGLADGLFAGWRYTEIGGREPDPAFVLNDPAYADARILLGGANFGCGSSREHAVWALAEFGFRVIIAPSFNPIFRGNCVRNGIVPVELPREVVEQLASWCETDHQVMVDLSEQTVRYGTSISSFPIEEEARQMLLNGLDAIALTSIREDEISRFIRADRASRGWAYIVPLDQADRPINSDA